VAQPHMGKLSRREAFIGFAYISPWLAGLVVFEIGPILASVYLSLTEYSILAPARFVGLANYRQALLDDPIFWKAVYNTIYYAVTFVPLSMVGSLAAALLLNQRLRGRSIFRTLFFIPSVTPVVATALIWMWILNAEFGPLNELLALVGVSGPAWLGSPQWAKPSMVLMSLWGAIGGGNMVIFLAGLQGIPSELYEATAIDGANELHQFWNVTLPLISPSLFFNLVISMVGAFHVFTQAYVATGGGPNYATMFYVLYLFEQAFHFLHMGYASALAWLFVVLVLGLVVLQFHVATRWVYYEGEQPR
jgi:multiple sugar transport system permease protein